MAQERIFCFDGPDEHIRRALLAQEPPWVETLDIDASTSWQCCVEDHPMVTRRTAKRKTYGNRKVMEKPRKTMASTKIAVEIHVFLYPQEGI
jgi:hypothetical protein